jgi:hypothetical protein
MHKERMLKIADAIEKNLKLFDMRHFNEPHPVDECQTSMCVGGWTYHLFNPHPEKLEDIEVVAKRLLELTYEEADHLFYGGNMFLKDITNNREFAPEAIRWMVDTGTIDWYTAMIDAGMSPEVRRK